jgi:hypothetical protein
VDSLVWAQRQRRCIDANMLEIAFKISTHAIVLSCMDASMLEIALKAPTHALVPSLHVHQLSEQVGGTGEGLFGRLFE